MLTVCGDKKVRLWDEAGEMIGQPRDHNKDLDKAIFSPAGDHVLSLDVGGTVRTWDAAGKQVGRASATTSR